MGAPAVITYLDRLLEPEELQRVTGGAKRPGSQIDRLKAMQIPYRIAPSTGEPLVLLSALAADDSVQISGENRPRSEPRIGLVSK